MAFFLLFFIFLFPDVGRGTMGSVLCCQCFFLCSPPQTAFHHHCLSGGSHLSCHVTNSYWIITGISEHHLELKTSKAEVLNFFLLPLFIYLLFLTVPPKGNKQIISLSFKCLHHFTKPGRLGVDFYFSVELKPSYFFSTLQLSP